MTSDDLFASVSKLLLAGGGGAAIAYGLFQFFGKRWLDNRFVRQQSALNAAFAERLQQIKAEQDRSARYIQSEIDRGIHRAKKLYDREFDVLSEAWLKLDEVFNVGTTMALDRLTAADPKPADEWKRRQKAFDELSVAFSDFIARNGIFMPPDIDAKFDEFAGIMRTSFIALGLPDVYPQNDLEKIIGSSLKNSSDLVEQLRQLVMDRLWSEGKVNGLADAPTAAEESAAVDSTAHRPKEG
jgi:hypothetical protein